VIMQNLNMWSLKLVLEIHEKLKELMPRLTLA
jgi:hypothetical protein